MKIVILVDYSSKEFNKDFTLSNMLIENGHNVFLAINIGQFQDLKKNCDMAVLGYSCNENTYMENMNILKDKGIIVIDKLKDTDTILNEIG